MSNKLKKRVAILTTGLAHGGAESQIFLIATGLIKRGWSIAVITMLDGGTYIERLARAGVEVHILGFKRGRFSLRAIVALIKLLIKIRPDIIHAHMFHANILARVAKILYPRASVLCTAHSVYEASTDRTELAEFTWREVAYRLTDFLCNHTTQVSESGARRYIKVGAVPAAKISRIYNGIKVEDFSPKSSTHASGPSPTGRFRWIAVGRLEAAKAYDDLVTAMAQHIGSGRDSELLIVGKGIEENQIRESIMKHNLMDRVQLLGFRTDVPALLNSANAYVLSSFYEGFPTVLLEAQAAGLPIVATNVGGVSEAFLPDKTGLLCAPRNPESISNAMNVIYDLPFETRVRMGLMATQHVENSFSIEKILDQWESLYMKISVID